MATPQDVTCFCRVRIGELDRNLERLIAEQELWRSIDRHIADESAPAAVHGLSKANQADLRLRIDQANRERAAFCLLLDLYVSMAPR
jgi:hypothetical protein